MIESCLSVPFSNAVLKTDIFLFGLLVCVLLVEEGYGGCDRLDAAVEGTAVDSVDLGREGEEMRREFVGLIDAFAGEGGVGGDSCWCGNGGGVSAGFGVDNLEGEC